MQHLRRLVVTNIQVAHQQPSTCEHFITGVPWMTRSGAQWRLLSKKYREWKAVCKRVERWDERGIWTAMLERFAFEPGTENVMIDATIV